MSTPNKKPVFIGQGLPTRTYEDCLDLRLNHNPNPTGEINIDPDPKKMERHIRESQAEALRALKS